MATRAFKPPWSYLRQASESSLRSFELSRLNHAANLRKEIVALLDQWLEETAEARLARCLLDLSPSLDRTPGLLKQPADLGEDPLE
jgi:hypothetical protein